MLVLAVFRKEAAWVSWKYSASADGLKASQEFGEFQQSTRYFHWVWKQKVCINYMIDYSRNSIHQWNLESYHCLVQKDIYTIVNLEN